MRSHSKAFLNEIIRENHASGTPTGSESTMIT